MAMRLRVEDKLQGAQNFPTRKERITMILDVSDAKEHIDSIAHRMCTPSAENLSNGCLLAEGRGAALGGKQRVRCCHLISTPPFRQTPNEANGGSP